MSSIVEITYTRGGRYPTISINGEPISRFMELSDLIFDDIFRWAERMYSNMDDELCEDYTVYLTGHPFHYTVLESLQKRSGYCKGIRFAPIEYKIPISDKLAYARDLNDRFHLAIAPVDEKVRFFSDEPSRFDGVLWCTDTPSDYYITAGNQFPANCGKFCVVVSNSTSFEYVRGVNYINIPPEKLGELADYLNLYHLHLKFIDDIFSAMKEVAAPEEQLKFEAYSLEEYRIKIDPIPTTLDCGNNYTINYSYYPEVFTDPCITARSSNSAVVNVNGKVLNAIDVGTASLTLLDRFGKNYGVHTVVVERHIYITDISIVIPSTTMQIGETMHIKCLFAPMDAEDLMQVRYAVSDNSVAAISGGTELYALDAGRVCVTVSTPRISKKVYITVLPQPNDLLLPQSPLSIPVNAEVEFSGLVLPVEANPKPPIKWISSNPRMVKIKSTGPYSCKMLTKEVYGSTSITCSVEGTNICKVLQVNVEKPKGCYVATAVYGSYDCPEVWVLRRFRDNFLDRSLLGRAFIKAYYATSPTAVKWFGKTAWFNRVWRGVLDTFTSLLKKKGYEDTPYQD